MEATLEAVRREGRGKNEANRLRASGRIPSVVYGTGSKGKAPEGAAVLELADAPALETALSGAGGAGGCTTVVQLIGTMRKRFSTGDTYETSDIGTTQQLVDAAKKTGVDHLVLLSSVGAGSPMGAYLQAKARAEAIVRESGIPFTIFRPSAFVGEGHRPPPGMKLLTRALGLAAPVIQHAQRLVRIELALVRAQDRLVLRDRLGVVLAIRCVQIGQPLASLQVVLIE